MISAFANVENSYSITDNETRVLEKREVRYPAPWTGTHSPLSVGQPANHEREAGTDGGQRSNSRRLKVAETIKSVHIRWHSAVLIIFSRLYF